MSSWWLENICKTLSSCLGHADIIPARHPLCSQWSRRKVRLAAQPIISLDISTETRMLLKYGPFVHIYSSTSMPITGYLLLGLVNQVSLLLDTTEWNFVGSGFLKYSLLKGKLPWILSLKTGELKSLGRSVFWRLCGGAAQIGTWAFEAVIILSLMWQFSVSRSIWWHSVI